MNGLMTNTTNAIISDLQNTTTSAYCSFETNDKKSANKLFNGTNNPDYRLADFINKEILLKDVYCEVVILKNDEGVEQQLPRIILFDVKGKSYTCVSIGIYSAIKKIISMFGEPKTWNEALSIEVKQVNKNNRSMLTLAVK